MNLELRCGDVVPGCDGVVAGATRQDVLDQAAVHARDAHGITTLDDPTRAALEAAIRTHAR